MAFRPSVATPNSWWTPSGGCGAWGPWNLWSFQTKNAPKYGNQLERVHVLSIYLSVYLSVYLSIYLCTHSYLCTHRRAMMYTYISGIRISNHHNIYIYKYVKCVLKTGSSKSCSWGSWFMEWGSKASGTKSKSQTVTGKLTMHAMFFSGRQRFLPDRFVDGLATRSHTQKASSFFLGRTEGRFGRFIWSFGNETRIVGKSY